MGNFSSDFFSAVFAPQPVNFCLFLSSTCLQGSSWFLLFTNILINLLLDGFPKDAVDYRWHRNGVFIARHTMAQFTVISFQVSSRVLKFDVGTFLLLNLIFIFTIHSMRSFWPRYFLFRIYVSGACKRQNDSGSKILWFESNIRKIFSSAFKKT